MENGERTESGVVLWCVRVVGGRGRENGGEGEKGEIMLESDPGRRIFYTAATGHASSVDRPTGKAPPTKTPRAARSLAKRVLCSGVTLLVTAICTVCYWCMLVLVQRIAK